MQIFTLVNEALYLLGIKYSMARSHAKIECAFWVWLMNMQGLQNLMQLRWRPWHPFERIPPFAPKSVKPDACT